MKKRLFRSRNDQMIAGVAAGIAEYFEVDPVLIRAIFIVLIFADGIGIILYLILAIVMPLEPLQESVKETSDENPSKDDTQEEQPHSSVDPSQLPEIPEISSVFSKKNNTVGGILLITLGFLFLLHNFYPGFDFGEMWPLLLVAIGVGLLFKH